MCSDVCECNVDGDALYGSFLKEMDEVPKYFAMSPMYCMLTADALEVSSIIGIPDQMCLSYHNFKHRRTFDEMFG